MEGSTDKLKGRVKQAAGDLTDDRDLKNEGRVDENAGKVKGTMGDVKDKLEGAIDAVTDKLKRR